MNPNSAHQLWSRWTSIVQIPAWRSHAGPDFWSAIQTRVANFYRVQFGSAGQMRITHTLTDSADGQAPVTRLVVDFRCEGAPTPDLSYQARVRARLDSFYRECLRHYGSVTVETHIRVEAGDVGDGRPPAQLIIAPAITNGGL